MKKTNNFKKVIASFALITMCVSPVATSALSVKNVYNSAYNTCSSAYNYIYNWIFEDETNKIIREGNEVVKRAQNVLNEQRKYLEEQGVEVSDSLNYNCTSQTEQDEIEAELNALDAPNK